VTATTDEERDKKVKKEMTKSVKEGGGVTAKSHTLDGL